MLTDKLLFVESIFLVQKKTASLSLFQCQPSEITSQADFSASLSLLGVSNPDSPPL